ncbi:YezD family protein [Blastomonas aquatica]|uniref:DUF2292 domain-containing protein n=1 Tax=Blastomonas aquatica TaxID=1510276 RepID=A0ABQ1J0R5_9SPHN|nr:YezD family protein [Blastomonas aquatica]GGB56732.1 hypothetical protein GCM10010833_09310 [Blastomonas aquatica]
MPPSKLPGSLADAQRDIPIAAIADAISKLRFGAVVLTVHDGKLVQMDVTERQRFS